MESLDWKYYFSDFDNRTLKLPLNEETYSYVVSPLLFVECKNWNTSIGPKEVRDFEVKMQNHAKLAKLGFLISYNGFTPGAKTELKRAGREDYHVVLIDKQAIEDFMKSGKVFYKWLENEIAILH